MPLLPARPTANMATTIDAAIRCKLTMMTSDGGGVAQSGVPCCSS
jgi:hypothetical protein